MPKPQDPNARSSAYNHYDNYLEGNRNSGAGALGMGMMSGDMDDDDEDAYANDNKHAALAAATGRGIPEPLPAPRPGYVASKNPFEIPVPAPAAAPEGRQMAQLPAALAAAGGRPPALLTTIPPPAPISVPSTPHPLPPTMTPITPAFARPVKPTSQRDVTFGREPIMRSNSEERLLPRRGEKGDDFWRRFSMIAKEEKSKPYKQSQWLRSTQNGTSRMSRCIWFVGLILLAAVGLGIGLGWYVAHNSKGSSDPTAVGGSANQASTYSPTSTVAATSSSHHVSPTNTVARRDAFPEPVPTGTTFNIVHVEHSVLKSAQRDIEADVDLDVEVAEKRAVNPAAASRHRRSHQNRTSY